MASETELQAEIKRLQGQVQESQQFRFQAMQLEQGYLAVVSMFSALVRELLLAIADPDDVEALVRAKRHAKEALKQWDLTMDAKAQQQMKARETQERKSVPLAAVPNDELKPSA